MILDIGGKMLGKMGYTVHSARNGKEAIEVYREYRETIDMVILDMIMPEMGGRETYTLMKEINPGVKVILSSDSIDGQAGEIMEQDCNGFLQKPFTLMELSIKARDVSDRE